MSVTPIAHKLHATKLKNSFPRFARASTLVPAEEFDVSVAKYYPPAPPGYALFIAPPPKPKWICSLQLNAQEYVTSFNQLLIYRALKALYGQADLAAATIMADQPGDERPRANLLDWSFTLSTDSDVLCEVRSKHFSRVHLEFWTPRLRTAEKKAALKKVVRSFCTALDEFLEKNLHLWDEATDVSGRCTVTAVANVPAERYKSAERLLEAAKQLDLRPKTRPLPVDETLPVQGVGYLYAAAAVQFFIALEAFVNLLYSQLLRREFRNRTYERLTARSEIDLRLVSMHLWCSGFAAQPVSPGTDLWQRIIDLRDFRNDMVHSNVTEEDAIHSFIEDGFPFYYWPATDFRGRKLEGRTARHLPRRQARITRQTVESVKSTVDACQASILAALDEETREWVRSWISRPFVQPRTNDGS
jgi:hypothetical protein